MDRRVYILVLGFILLFTNVNNVDAKTLEDDLSNLYNLTETLYKSVKVKDYNRSKPLIEEISNYVTTINYKGLTTIEGMEAISSTVIKTKESLTALEPNYETIFHNTTQLYLAVDALIHKEQPLWHRYNSIIQQDLNNIQRVINSEDTNQIQVAIQNLQLHYNIFKPAIYVSKPAYYVEKINSLITALESQTEAENKDIILKELSITFYQLFFGDEQETWAVMSDGVLLRASLGISLIIFVVLSYVIWRKFRGSHISK